MGYLDILSMLMVFLSVGYIGYKSTLAVKSSNEFILADRKLTKFQAAISTAATDLGGSGLVGAIAFVYVIGLSGALWNLIAAPAYFIIAFTLSKRLRRVEVATISEFLGKMYGERVRLFTAILQLVSLTTVIASQFLVSSIAIQVIFGVPQTLALLLSVIIVLLYTVGGGLIAVVKTDILQFFILMTTVLMTIFISLNEVGGLAAIAASVPNDFLRFDSLGFWTPLSWLLMMIFGYSTNQSGLQRIFAAKDESTAVFAFAFTGVLYIIYGLMVGLLGLMVYMLVPGLEDPNMGFALLIQQVLPQGMVGLALGGLFAATMSSADSILLAASSIFVKDIYVVNINRDADDQRILRATRITTVMVAAIGIAIAQISNNIIDIVYFSGVIYSSVVFFPLVIGIYNEKLKPKAVEVSIGIAVLVGLISEFYLSKNFTGFLGLPSNILSALSSLIVIILVSMIIRKKESVGQ